MLFIRSLMSETGKDRSTRESPSTEPSLWKYPTPLEYSTTCPIGRLVGFTASSAFLAVAGRAPEKDVQARPIAARVTPAETASVQARRMRDSPEDEQAAGRPAHRAGPAGLCPYDGPGGRTDWGAGRGGV